MDADGRLINVGAGAQPDPRVASIEPRLSALDALLAAGRAVGAAVVPGQPTRRGGVERATDFADGQRASLTVMGDRLAWRVLLRADARHFYDAVVDADNGDTLYRVNLVREATALAFDNYPGAPQGGTQTAKVFDPPWLTASDSLMGQNAHVYTDPEDDIDGFPPPAPDPAPGHEIAPSAPGAWNYTQEVHPATSPGQDCPPVGCSWNNFALGFSWRDNLAQAGTQLFYFVNLFHDHLRDAPGIGFGASSNNFEGSDRVNAQVDDGAATAAPPDDDFPACSGGPSGQGYTNNAFVIPVPEGMPLVMQLYLWSSFCTGGSEYDVNPADDALIVYHEYTHGMTNRLVTDAGRVPGDERGAARRHGRGPCRLVRPGCAERAGLRAGFGCARGAAGGQVRARRPAQPAVRLPGRRVAGRLPGNPGSRLGWLHVRRLRQGRWACPRCTPTGRSGWRRCGTCAPG